MNKRIEIESYILGLIFLISGFIKATNASLFISTIEAYNIGILTVFAPLVIIIEVYLGLLFILNKHKSHIAIIGGSFFFLVTSIFLYGWLFNGVTDCGCFGKLSILDNSPWFTLLRNIILISMCFDIYFNNKIIKTTSIKALNVKNITITCSLVLCAFMSGYTSKALKIKSQKQFEPIPISNSELPNLISTSPDSTYLIFAFSYKCPHCINSISNLNHYEKSGIVNKVIALAVENKQLQNEFNDFFNPTFKIKHIEKQKLHKLTKAFPVAYFIRNDSIIDIVSGELPSAFLFKKHITPE